LDREKKFAGQKVSQKLLIRRGGGSPILKVRGDSVKNGEKWGGRLGEGLIPKAEGSELISREMALWGG